AVLKIAEAKLNPLPMANSDDVKVGQLVFAIGNPFGLQATVTAGIISAKGRRNITDSDIEFLQTDAAVNHGNSGGPLINLRGEIVGINTAIYSKSNDGGWLGISFAIPSNVARHALESVIKRGRIVRGFLGIEMADMTPNLAALHRIPMTEGVMVTHVTVGSPAEQADLRPFDIIRSFNGEKATDTTRLRVRLDEVDIGQRISLAILRGGKEQIISAQIAEAPREKGADVPAGP
ncbi:MAG: trypsin-like peptidase domain-containing protein, partial [Chthoniobacteraceae bacterium]